MMQNFRRSYVLADITKQPSPGIGPLPVQRARRKPQSFSHFSIAQPAEEFQHDNALQFGIFFLEERQRLINQQNLVVGRRLSQF